MIMTGLQFKSTVYMKLVYTTNKMRMIILSSALVRQVDDYLVTNRDYMEYDRIGEMIQARMTNPLNQLRVIRSSKLIYKQTSRVPESIKE